MATSAWMLVGATLLASPPSPDEHLSHGDVAQVVTVQRPNVIARCWLAGAPSAATRAGELGLVTTRVVVSLAIQPSGRTSDVRAKADDARFDGVARCVAAEVRAWRFRATRTTTHVNVPFVLRTP